MYTCTTCNKSYIGETSQHLHKRYKQHTKDSRSAIYEHALHCSADLGPDHLTVLDKQPRYWDRRASEALHITIKKTGPNQGLNRDIGLSSIMQWSPILRKLK